jgi:hypothetical protein
MSQLQKPKSGINHRLWSWARRASDHMGFVGWAGRSSTEKTNSMLGISEEGGAARTARYMALREASAFWRLMLSTRKVSIM